MHRVASWVAAPASRHTGNQHICFYAWVHAYMRIVLPQLVALQGRTRLAKYYAPIPDAERRKLEYEVHRLVVNRDPKHTNMVEVSWDEHYHLESVPWRYQ